MNAHFDEVFDFLMQVLIFQLLFLLLFYCQYNTGTYTVQNTGMHGYTDYTTYGTCMHFVKCIMTSTIILYA